MADNQTWIAALRSSHERLAAALRPLDELAVRRQSYASEWTIADVASHLGSQAEIFQLFLDAGLTGEPAPSGDEFPPIWDRWNTTPPPQQVRASIEANEALVTRIENLTATEREEFALTLFGRDVDLGGFAAMRLGEHAVHAWDILVALDPSATIAADAVDLLVDQLAGTAARVGKPVEDPSRIVVSTVDPQRRFVLTTGPEVSLDPAPADDPSAEPGAGLAELDLPAESLIRLVYGRLDPEHTPEPIRHDEVLIGLRRLFPGF